MYVEKKLFLEPDSIERAYFWSPLSPCVTEEILRYEKKNGNISEKSGLSSSPSSHSYSSGSEQSSQPVVLSHAAEVPKLNGDIGESAGHSFRSP